MAALPDDKVTTYGDLAAMAGHPGAARIIGGIAHYGPENLPWHRLVNAEGRVAIGYPGGQHVQCQLLVGDGITLDENYRVEKFIQRRWLGEDR